MMTTTKELELLSEADGLVQTIFESDYVQLYLEKKQQMNDNPKTQARKKAFVKIKERYDEVQRFGRHHPDYKEITRQARKLKRELDMDEFVAEFKRAEMDLQSLLDEISIMLAGAVSTNIKVPTGNPFFVKNSGCSGGGSCGCAK
ncbi:YlbF family regulator [Listeria sp. PSOL-1]|uniref:YlbF family regulator n=1 Tax=Listeria sp. PSOL-1 TaxID=1844999 RepID=UPI0013D69C6F|nr:YlbF family regulator [Listeria sp. PSOL-1]